jgi:hypothetical protein
MTLPWRIRPGVPRARPSTRMPTPSFDARICTDSKSVQPGGVVSFFFATKQFTELGSSLPESETTREAQPRGLPFIYIELVLLSFTGILSKNRAHVITPVVTLGAATVPISILLPSFFGSEDAPNNFWISGKVSPAVSGTTK